MDLKNVATQTLGLIDLTSLNDNDTDEVILELCKKAHTNFGNVPAICIYRQFIPTAKKYFTENELPIKIATVTNFPHGSDNLETAIVETKDAIRLGADEVDIVFPYKALKAGNEKIGAEMIRKAKEACGDKILKVIIESGELASPLLIAKASEISIENGADFIKTSTGKVKINATLDATEMMLWTIKKMDSSCGFKAAGGIRSVREAADYLQLTKEIMGSQWINSGNFRFGASSLLNDVLDTLTDKKSTTANNNAY